MFHISHSIVSIELANELGLMPSNKMANVAFPPTRLLRRKGQRAPNATLDVILSVLAAEQGDSLSARTVAGQDPLDTELAQFADDG
jgi:hypothetical protein